MKYCNLYDFQYSNCFVLKPGKISPSQPIFWHFFDKKQTSVQFTQWRTGCKMNLHYPTPLCNCCTDMYVLVASPVWLKILLQFFFFWLTFASTIFNKLRWKDVLVSFFFSFWEEGVKCGNFLSKLYYNIRRKNH